MIVSLIQVCLEGKFDFNGIQSSSKLLRYKDDAGFQSQTLLVLSGLMAELARFPLLLIMAAIMIAVGVAAEDPQSKLVGKRCSPHIYVNATAFADNLDNVLQSLFLYLSADGFATSMQIDSGKTDPVYGLAVCRKYLNASECSQCVKEAAGEAKAVCPEANGARIHFDGCLLRYENNTFYTQYVDPGNYVYCAGTNSSDPQTFLERAQDLSTQLITNPSKNMVSLSVGLH